MLEEKIEALTKEVVALRQAIEKNGTAAGTKAAEKAAPAKKAATKKAAADDDDDDDDDADEAPAKKSAATKVNGPASSRRRVRNCSTWVSRSLAISETCDLLSPVIPSDWTSLSIRRVETPSR